MCSVYNHLFLLCSSKLIFPIRASLSRFCHRLVWKLGLWSAHLGYCALQTVFYCMLNYDSYILVGIKLSLPLDTGDNVLVGHVRWWVRHELFLHFQDLTLPLMFVLTVYLCKGCSHGWMNHSTCVLGSLSGLSLLELISASTAPQG